MAKQPQVQYINQYISGTMAYQPEVSPRHEKKARLPKPRRERKLLIEVRPAALLGIALAVVLLVMLVSGAVQMFAAQREAEQLQAYVQTLQQTNAELANTYASGYDLEEIQDLALAMGMIPAEQAEQTQVSVTLPKETAEPTTWESFVAFFKGLFA